MVWGSRGGAKKNRRVACCTCECTLAPACARACPLLSFRPRAVATAAALKSSLRRARALSFDHYFYQTRGDEPRLGPPRVPDAAARDRRVHVVPPRDDGGRGLAVPRRLPGGAADRLGPPRACAGPRRAGRRAGGRRGQGGARRGLGDKVRCGPRPVHVRGQDGLRECTRGGAGRWLRKVPDAKRLGARGRGATRGAGRGAPRGAGRGAPRGASRRAHMQSARPTPTAVRSRPPHARRLRRCETATPSCWR